MYGSLNNVQGAAQSLDDDIIKQLGFDPDKGSQESAQTGIAKTANDIKRYLDDTEDSKRSPKGFENGIKVMKNEVAKNEKRLLQKASRFAWKCANDKNQPFVVYDAKVKKCRLYSVEKRQTKKRQLLQVVAHRLKTHVV